MSIFKKSPEQIRKQVLELENQATKSFNAEFNALKQESIDFANVMESYAMFKSIWMEFNIHPNEDKFNLAMIHFESLKKDFEKIKTKRHNIEQLFDWLKAQLNSQELLIMKIKAASMTIK
ncbi:MAG: hypothetical protein UV40_C0007G0018 [Parcubacteria group bacterium GW2011_GWA1_42_7]|nr:MAG: hypothetical protein UV40_C0007G0018 [Parcubacteria group bacterium GW2011_GWA1_42_7]MBS3166830.1 hypothetical protein [Candidatus Woesearchaeota archaeon]